MVLEVYKIKRPEHIIFGDSAYFEQYSGDQLRGKVFDYVTPTYYDARVRLHQYPEPDGVVRQMGLYLAPAKHIDTYTGNRLLKGQDTVEYGYVDDRAASYYVSVDGKNRVILTCGCECWGEVVNIIHAGKTGNVLDGKIVKIRIPGAFNFDGMRELARFFFGELGPPLYQRSTPDERKPSIRTQLSAPSPHPARPDAPQQNAVKER